MQAQAPLARSVRLCKKDFPCIFRYFSPAGQASWYLHAFEEQWHKQTVLGLPASTYSRDETKPGPGCTTLDCGYKEAHAVGLASQFLMTGAFVGGERLTEWANGGVTQCAWLYINKEGMYMKSQVFLYSPFNGIGKNLAFFDEKLRGKPINLTPSKVQTGNDISWKSVTTADYQPIVDKVQKILKQ